MNGRGAAPIAATRARGATPSQVGATRARGATSSPIAALHADAVRRGWRSCTR
jgi:hypothetical protein